MNELPFIATGNLVRDPELRITSTGRPVVSMTIASAPRRFNATSRTWEDGVTSFVDVTAWDHLAENIAASLSGGARVVALGRWVTRVYTPQTGPNAGTAVRRLEAVVDDLAPSLRWADATVRRVKPGADDEPGDLPVDEQPTV